MLKIRFVTGLCLASCASVVAAGCAEGQGAQRGNTAQGAGVVAAPTSVVARVGDEGITLEEVDKKALQADAMDYRGMKLGQALYEARRQAVDELVADILLDAEAKKRGVSRDALVEREVASKVKPVADADLETWYRDNAARVGGQPLESVKEPLRSLLNEQRKQEVLGQYLAALRTDTPVTVMLDPPRVEIAIAANDPTAGPPGAAVEIVEFSDFQ